MKITGTGASNPGVMKVTGTGASNPGEMNPAYTVIAGMLPTPPTLPTHSVDISPIAFYATTAGTGMANVTVTSLTNEDIKGDVKVTEHYYTRTTGNVLVQWEYAGDQTVINFTGLTLHPQQTINLPVFISVGTATLPLIVVLEAEFILTGVP
jgi:hypothetical protein